MSNGGGGSQRWLGIAVGALVFLVLGFYAGYLVEKGRQTVHTAFEPVVAGQIGNAARGRELYTSYGCVQCHSFEGKGGTDGPSLDSMRGKLAATDLATMTGDIWNHVPQMQGFFKEEKIPFPTFKGHQMDDLIAYLHGGGPAPMMGKGMTGMGQGGAQMGHGGGM